MVVWLVVELVSVGNPPILEFGCFKEMEILGLGRGVVGSSDSMLPEPEPSSDRFMARRRLLMILYCLTRSLSAAVLAACALSIVGGTDEHDQSLVKI